MRPIPPRIRAALLSLAVPFSVTLAQGRASAQRPMWEAVYKHDRDGRPLAGDKQALIEAVRRGEAVRVSWGVQHPRDSARSVEHTALPVFTTIVDGAEVFVQVAEHVAFADYWARDAQEPGNPRVTWTGVLGTTGAFNAVFYDRASGTEARRLPQRVTMTWFVQRVGDTTSGENERQAAPPLYSTERRLP